VIRVSGGTAERRQHDASGGRSAVRARAREGGFGLLVTVSGRTVQGITADLGIASAPVRRRLDMPVNLRMAKRIKLTAPGGGRKGSVDAAVSVDEEKADSTFSGREGVGALLVAIGGYLTDVLESEREHVDAGNGQGARS
jgi:hypothetical protein